MAHRLTEIADKALGGASEPRRSLVRRERKVSANGQGRKVSTNGLALRGSASHESATLSAAGESHVSFTEYCLYWRAPCKLY